MAAKSARAQPGQTRTAVRRPTAAPPRRRSRRSGPAWPAKLAPTSTSARTRGGRRRQASASASSGASATPASSPRGVDRLQTPQGPDDGAKARQSPRPRPPMTSVGAETCSVIAAWCPPRRTTTCAVHSRISAPYPRRDPDPDQSLPATASTAPSSRKMRRIFAAEKPSARSTPISRDPLLDPELEEQTREEQGRDHQEEAEVHEVLAKVCRALRRLQTLSPHGDDGQPHLRQGRAPREAPAA